MATVTFNGNVARPEMKELGGKPAVSFSVAENHQRKNRNTGNYEDSGTTWFRVTYFGNRLLSAQALYDAISEPKSMVLVTGRQETREYEKDGETRTSLEVTADQVGVLQKEGQGQRSGGGYSSRGYAPQADPWAQSDADPAF